LLLGALSVNAMAQALYKYEDENGEIIFTDRPPGDDTVFETRVLPTGAGSPEVTVSSEEIPGAMRLRASNGYRIPVEIIVALDRLQNIASPDPDRALRWVLDPLSTETLVELPFIKAGAAAELEFRHIWLPGDPEASHQPLRAYRAPFAIANAYPISQAFPSGQTHDTPDSYYAVDIAMPVGTGIYAAREGIVFEVASDNFRGGLDIGRDAAAANIVRILHDDGSHAVYAHLNWNSIRVRPGDRVQRGEYIADSGNTGFTSGPHLHFAVMVNRGMRLVSVPVFFEGPNAAALEPATGNILSAY
jgi:murein DD-endopeptidase MepM/ murein hydrolase activator NlpD